MNKQPELTEADRKAIDELVEKEFFVNARPGLKRGAEWGVKYARAEAIAIIPKANACHLCNYWTREKGCDHRGPDYHYQTEERIFSRINNLEAGIVFHATFERQQAERIAELEAENKAVKEEWAAHIEYHKTVVAKRNELEAEAARLKEEIALFFRTNVQAPRTAFERLAKAASKPYNSPTVVQSSVQSPKATPRCFKCGSFDLVPSSTGGTACWKCHAEQPPSVQSPEAKSYNFPPLTKDQQYWFDLWGKGSKDIPTSWEQRPPIESPSLVNDQLLEACKSALWSGAIRFANNALDRSIKEKLEAAIAKASKEEL
jgi:hypothetical protein